VEAAYEKDNYEQDATATPNKKPPLADNRTSKLQSAAAVHDKVADDDDDDDNNHKNHNMQEPSSSSAPSAAPCSNKLIKDTAQDGDDNDELVHPFLGSSTTLFGKYSLRYSESRSVQYLRRFIARKQRALREASLLLESCSNYDH